MKKKVPTDEVLSGLVGWGHFEGLMPEEVLMTSTTFHDAFLGPTDLALAKRVLDRVCAERAIELDSRDAGELAASLIRQLQRGTRDEDRLMTLFGTTRRPRRRRPAAGWETPRRPIR